MPFPSRAVNFSTCNTRLKKYLKLLEILDQDADKRRMKRLGNNYLQLISGGAECPVSKDQVHNGEHLKVSECTSWRGHYR